MDLLLPLSTMQSFLSTGIMLTMLVAWDRIAFCMVYAQDGLRIRWTRFFLLVSLGLILAGIYFSFTRAAWLCVPLAIGSLFYHPVEVDESCYSDCISSGILSHCMACI